MANNSDNAFVKKAVSLQNTIKGLNEPEKSVAQDQFNIFFESATPEDQAAFNEYISGYNVTAGQLRERILKLIKAKDFRDKIIGKGKKWYKKPIVWIVIVLFIVVGNIGNAIEGKQEYQSPNTYQPQITNEQSEKEKAIENKRIADEEAEVAEITRKADEDRKNAEAQAKAQAEKDAADKAAVEAEAARAAAEAEAARVAAEQEAARQRAQQNSGTNSGTTNNSPNSGVTGQVSGYCNDGTYVTGDPSAKGKANACYGHKGWRDY